MERPESCRLLGVVVRLDLGMSTVGSVNRIVPRNPPISISA